MSAYLRPEDLPFPIGTTFFDSTTTPDATKGLEYEGLEFVVPDVDYAASSEVKPLRSVQMRTVRIVRNKYAVANLLPKRLAVLQGASPFGAKVNAYAITSAADTPQIGFPIDEFLPSTGVRENDLFYVVVEGPAIVLRQIANLSADIAIGDWLVAVTAASSGATTAGRVGAQDLTGATAPLAANVMHRIGRAMSTSATSAGSSDVLVNVGVGSRWR